MYRAPITVANVMMPGLERRVATDGEIVKVCERGYEYTGMFVVLQ